ncbi:helix-turn-helix transcriptional regulator [Streptococcus macedonicus]|uniref:Helix-turn-helix domain-containing protein n=1 Tax=Streptococcus macedonicus TaxID=59310 RepID=A0A2G3NZV3_STRMC|nr:helix-turn-helix transcriptional regulator [Streptococcus macedonicus]MCW8485696.1 helix-turn-helix domain-containing protein [Streptococcus macedonicus]MCW8493919.1 helix-turn-helix domain-containing protein [Streptococcus macedonicus]MCW8499136.1 helix-turn-helix domain-containing protein [Streptococcus macedonicus]MCW8501205.1 helix-turn-helix domain-containing protein [Streptococcus macedonicus]MCW8503215.1 helix-turn-helix domain-containing protein [Streptococcus macedonicus]
MNYTNNLKDLRKKAGYTQEELAKKIGISKRTLAYWEKGENSIKADKAEQLAKLFGVSIGVLLGYRNENDSLGFRLWSLRNQKGIKLEKAASDLKLSVDELKLIEQTDNAELGDALAKDFAKYYNVSVGDLLGYEDKEAGEFFKTLISAGKNKDDGIVSLGNKELGAFVIDYSVLDNIENIDSIEELDELSTDTLLANRLLDRLKEKMIRSNIVEKEYNLEIEKVMSWLIDFNNALNKRKMELETEQSSKH